MTDWTKEKHAFVPKRDDPKFCIVCDFPHDEYNVHHKVRVDDGMSALLKAAESKSITAELDEILADLEACKDASPATHAVIRLIRAVKRMESKPFVPHTHISNMVFG